MDLFRMKCFVAVSRHLSLSKAAKEMFITQPSMTQQMKNLEDELGVTLFIRGRKGILLTEAGKFVAKKFVDIISKYDNMFSELKVMQNSRYGKIRVGFHGSPNWLNFSDFLKVFRKDNPNIEVELVVDTWNSLKERLLSLELDVAFIEATELQGYPDIVSTIVFYDHLSVMMPKTHPLASKELLRPEELKDESIVVPAYITSPAFIDKAARGLKKYGLVDDDHLQGNHYDALSVLVASGYGVSILPDCLCSTSQRVNVVPLDVDVSVEISLAWHREKQNTVTKKFTDFACSYFRGDEKQNP
ncbi:MAG: LysR family transcriptional regulator [Candidatus Scatomorpha sp.]